MTKYRPKVSVIMTVYNADKFLEQSVGSILDQTYDNIELICFNDASTDHSIDVLRRLATDDNRIKIIDSSINIGPGGGRNSAIKAASGQFIMFLDADDILRTDAVDLCVNTALANNSEAVFFDYCRFSSDSSFEQKVSTLGDDAAALKGDDLKKRILLRTTSHCTGMYARSAFVDNDLFYPGGVLYEDNAIGLALQTIVRNPVKINEVLYRYRYDNISITRSANNIRFFDRMKTAVMLLDNMKRLGLYERFKELIDFQFINLYYVHTIYGAIYRFDRVQYDKILQAKSGIKQYLPDYKRNQLFRKRPWKDKIKLMTHVHCPRVIKLLSNFNRRLQRFL